MKIFQLVSTQDLPGLPEALIDDLPFFRDILEVDPYACCGKIRCHLLEREPLNENCYAMELNYLGVSYRLVYRILEPQKRVEILSFDDHKSAYHKAEERVRRFTGYKGK